MQTTVKTLFEKGYNKTQIGEKIGMPEDLKKCFPDRYRQILSIAYYLILEGTGALYRFEKWHSLHRHPYGKDITSQRSSELFASFTEEEKSKFFRLQGMRRAETEFWAYDITSISSYSKLLRQVQYGKSWTRSMTSSAVSKTTVRNMNFTTQVLKQIGATVMTDLTRRTSC